MSDFPSVIQLAALSASEGFKLVSDSPGTDTGFSVAGAGDVNGDGLADIVIGSPDGFFFSGLAWVVYGKTGERGLVELPVAEPPASETSDELLRLHGSEWEFAYSLDGAGDLNGDGYADVIIGDPQGYYDYYGSSGGAHILAGGKGDAVIKDLEGSRYDHMGTVVSAAGDVNGDGFDDVLMMGNSFGADVYLVFGSASFFDDDHVLLTDLPDSDAIHVTGPEHTNSWIAPSASSAGDFNGDGSDDILIGTAPYQAEVEARSLHLIFGKSSGMTDIDLADLGAADGITISFPNGSEDSPSHLSSIGDFNGDGRDDLVIGSSRTDKAYVLFGAATPPATLDLGTLTAQQGFLIDGGATDSLVGHQVSSAGDVNGDGFNDLIVAAPSIGENQQEPGGVGRAYVLFGRSAGFGPVQLDELTPEQGFAIEGETAGDHFGISVSSAGDVNGDGFTDLVVGADHADVGDHAEAGAAYVIYGRAPTAEAVRVGSAAAQTIRGGAFDDRLAGLAGNDVLVGGDGNDRLNGGSGQDTSSYFNSAAAVRVDLALSGTQNTRSSGLDTLVSVENVGGSEFGDILFGNAAANRLAGRGGNDRIDGRGGGDLLAGADGNDRLVGGSGIDTMQGGAGSDWYDVRESRDVVAEGLNGGIDTVVAYAAFTLGRNVEKLTLGGSLAIGGTGNALANSLVGNAAANRLSGLEGNDLIDGRSGADTMIGGLGNDTYFVDRVEDVAIERAGQGRDVVRSAGSFALGAHIEELRLAGTGASAGTGNAQANTIVGNSAANEISGAAGNDSLSGGLGDDRLSGGLGNDLLRGGGGIDRFVFDAILHPGTNVDAISDFVAADDSILLDRNVFDSIGATGVLGAGALRVGVKALDANDRIIHDTGSGRLFYDSDGSGAAEQVLFARVEAGLALARADFLVFHSSAAAAVPARGYQGDPAAFMAHMERLSLAQESPCPWP